MDPVSSQCPVTYSIVVPLYNEEENIDLLYKEINAVMSGLDQPWELILIDDGSSDTTPQKVHAHAQSQPHVRGLFFEKNWGQSAAFAAGFAVARGNFVITMDGDRQNDPADIPKLIAHLDGADLIVGWRVNRQDSWFKRWISKFSNTFRKRICNDGIHDTGCSLKLMKREALFSLPTFKGMHRFLPALFVMNGKCVKEIPVNHRKRELGTTKYHFFNRLSPLIDLFVVWWLQKRWVNVSNISYTTSLNP